METIRCLVCQGQSIADSMPRMAGDMRSMIRERIQAGEQPEAIRAWLISRYGEWVSYQPPFDWRTWPLFAAPFLLLLGRALAGARPLPPAEERLMGGWLSHGPARCSPSRPGSIRSRAGTRARCNSSPPLCCSRSPAMAGRGSPARPAARSRPSRRPEVPDDDFAILRPDLLGRFDRAAYWMTLADADRRRGNPHGAAAGAANPRCATIRADAALWIAYGYALSSAGGDER